MICGTFIALVSFAADVPTTFVFDVVNDADELTVGSDYFIVSAEAVPYAVISGDTPSSQYLISSKNNSGLCVRAIGEGSLQALTLSGYDASYCTFVQNGVRYLGYDPSTGGLSADKLSEDELTDYHYFSVTSNGDGRLRISPHSYPSVSLGLRCGDADGFSLYEFHMFADGAPEAVQVILARGYTECLTLMPEITSTDGMTIAEPIVPEGYELYYRIRCVEQKASRASEPMWKAWNRQSYVDDLWQLPTDEYDLDMKYIRDGLESPVTTLRLTRPILTGISDATAAGGLTVVVESDGTVNVTSAAPVTIATYDASGAQVAVADAPAGSTRTSLCLSAGLYLVRVTDVSGRTAVAKAAIR